MNVLQMLRRRSLRRGVLEGNRAWLLLGGAVWGLRALQLALRSAPERVFVGDLRPGESILVSSRPAPLSGRRRRRARRAERKATRRARRR
ncbi:MAG: hypothetical protein ACKOIA_00245 [Acidimicrobiia bacterium]|jgi:hypothetical protein